MGPKNYQYEQRFPNGYGVSVVCNDMSYGNKSGLFQVAVTDEDGKLLHKNPVIETVQGIEGWCDFRMVADLIDKIKALPPRS